MEKTLLYIRDLDLAGQVYTYTDQQIWTKPIEEFALSCRITENILAEVFVLPTEDGCFLRGTLKGKVALSCNRCAEETEVVVEHSFDDFQEFPVEVEVDALSVVGNVIYYENDILCINLQALLWEEFCLTVPIKPLCKTSCKGICQECGQNKNIGSCSCIESGGDHRFTVLQGLKLQ